jgi:hypothetical protein
MKVDGQIAVDETGEANPDYLRLSSGRFNFGLLCIPQSTGNASCRKRMWAGGNFGMAQTLFTNVQCWLTHMALDEETGLDIEGISLRAATGLEAVDYFLPGGITSHPVTGELR